MSVLLKVLKLALQLLLIGGIKYSGDVAKALAVGASAVMMGEHIAELRKTSRTYGRGKSIRII